MAPKNKKRKPNAFMTFAAEWHAQHAPSNWSLQKCIPEAGQLWEKMSMAERQPYKNKANNLLHSPLKSDDKVSGDARRNCMGDLIEDVAKQTKSVLSQERMNIRTIDKIIRPVVADGQLESTKFYFIMVNYFTKSLSGEIYVPAEIAFAEFSLEGGVSRVYHSHINPGVNAFGQRYQTEQYVSDTHRLPLPPNALGEENMTKIYVDLLSFLDKSADSDGNLPPIYTTKNVMPVVDNVLKFMKDPCHPDIRILPIEYLFFVLKDETCKACGLERPKTQFITDIVFQRDKFEHQQDIGCQYHEDIDRSKYCAQSCVVRWGYQFADYICLDLAILLQPGTHTPNKKNAAFIIVEPSERIKKRKAKERNEPLKQEASEELTINSAAPGTSSKQQGPRNKSNNDLQLKNKILNDSGEDDTSLKDEFSSDSEDEKIIPPPPLTNVDFGICDLTMVKEDETYSSSIISEHGDLSNIDNTSLISGRSISPVLNIRRSSSDTPEQRKSYGLNGHNEGRLLSRSPVHPRQNVTRSRDGTGSISRRFENDRRRSPSPIFNSEERQYNRDHNRLNRDRSRSPLRSVDRDRSNSPLHNFSRDRTQSPTRRLDRNLTRSPLHMDRDLNRSSMQQQRGRSPTRFVIDDYPAHGLYQQNKQAMMPNNECHSDLRNQLGNHGERDGCQNVDHSSDGQWQRNCPPVHNIPFHSDQNIQHQHLQTIETQQQTFGYANIWQQNRNQQNHSYGGGSAQQQQNDLDNGNNFVREFREYLQDNHVESSQSPIIQVIIPPRIAQLPENDLRHRLKKSDRGARPFHGNNQRDLRNSNCNPRNGIGNNQIDVGIGQRDPRMLIGNNQRDGRVVQRDPRMLDGNNQRDGRGLQRDPRMLDGNNQRDGRGMQHDPRMLNGNNQRDGRGMQHDSRILNGNNQRDLRNSNCNPRNGVGNNQIDVGIGQRDPRMLIGNNQRDGRVMQHDPRNGQYGPRFVRNDHRDDRNAPYDPRLFVGNDQGQRDQRIFHGNNQSSSRIGHMDPRMIVGNTQYDPRLGNRDPRMVANNNQSNRDPRQMIDNNDLGRFVRSEFGLGTSNNYNFN